MALDGVDEVDKEAIKVFMQLVHSVHFVHSVGLNPAQNPKLHRPEGVSSYSPGRSVAEAWVKGVTQK